MVWMRLNHFGQQINNNFTNRIIIIRHYDVWTPEICIWNMRPLWKQLNTFQNKIIQTRNEKAHRNTYVYGLWKTFWQTPVISKSFKKGISFCFCNVSIKWWWISHKHKHKHKEKEKEHVALFIYLFFDSHSSYIWSFQADPRVESIDVCIFFYSRSRFRLVFCIIRCVGYEVRWLVDEYKTYFFFITCFTFWWMCLLLETLNVCVPCPLVCQHP